MDTSPNVEKRHHHRLGLGVVLRVSIPGESTVYKGRPSDLSPSGARIKFPRLMAVNDRVHIHIILPEKDIGCEGQICWVKPVNEERWAFGLRFMEMDSYERAYLEAFLGKAEL